MTCKSNEQRKRFLCHDVAVIIYLKNRIDYRRAKGSSGFSQRAKAAKAMQKYCKSAEMFVSWRSSVCVVLELCSCQTGLPSESNANIRIFSGKSKQKS